MSVLDRLAAAQGRRDEAPNQELARELAERGDREGIRELVANLGHADQNVRSDCLKTLYEIGYLKPELVAEYAAEFLRLLRELVPLAIRPGAHRQQPRGVAIGLRALRPLAGR